MQQRKPDPFNLYILGNDQTISAVWKTLPPYTIILYPVSQNGEKAYNARLKLADEKNTTDSIDVSMGHLKFSDTGFISKKTPNYPTLVTSALKQISSELVEKNTEVPQEIKDRLAYANMQIELAQYDGPRYENACEQKKKRENEAATQALIFDLIARDPEPPKEETKSSTVEHKKPQAPRDKTPNNPDAKEVGPDLPSDIGNLIFELAAEPNHTKYGFPNTSAKPSDAELTLFRKPFLTLHSTLFCKPLFNLQAELTSIDKIVLSMSKGSSSLYKNIKHDPTLLNSVFTLKDPCGTPITGTLLQIAAMTGDDEEDDGLVDQLAATGRLSHKRVANELKCVTSDEAQAENDARIKRYVDIIIEFGTSIGREDNKDEAIQVFKAKLQAERSKEVRAGLVFDLRILQEAAAWFDKNMVQLFDNNLYSDKSNTFWINGFGTLQRMLSPCDARVILTGIRDVVEQGRTPKRDPWIIDTALDFNRFYQSDLGVSFFLGTDGKIMKNTRCPENYFSSDSTYYIIGENRCTTFKRHIQSYIEHKYLRKTDPDLYDFITTKIGGQA